jgi:hypothetical protein
LKEAEVISWIFMAIAMASESEAAGFSDISRIADGINHAIPTPKEMQISIKWLLNKGLVTKQGKRYILTSQGLSEYKGAIDYSKSLFKNWKSLEIKLKSYS